MELLVIGMFEKSYREGGSSHGTALPAEMIETVINVIKNHELSEGISEELIEGIALEAIHEGTLDDNIWLEQKLTSIAKANKQEDTRIEFEAELEKILIPTPQHVENQEQLEEIIRLHNLWIESVLGDPQEQSGRRANFEETDLTGMDFSGVNLSCANFKGAKLAGCNFRSAILSKADFENADLTAADFSGAKIIKANLTNAKLDDLQYEKTNFRNATLVGTSLEDLAPTLNSKTRI